jgi:type IV secretory pathway TrbL component
MLTKMKIQVLLLSLAVTIPLYTNGLMSSYPTTGGAAVSAISYG